MTKCLGYYGASDAINEKLDYDGRPPKLSEETKEKIVAAIAEDYPDIKNCSDGDKKAITQWVINENDG